MKKLQNKLKCHYSSKQSKTYKRGLAVSRRRKARKRKEKVNERKERRERLKNPEKYLQIDLRRKIKKEIYEPKTYTNEEVTVEIKEEFGLETKESRQYFLDKAASFIEFRPKELFFDISQCDRFWPSGVTLLCSLSQWVDLTSKKGYTRKIRSCDANKDEVNSYLSHCGFYQYVGRVENPSRCYFDDKQVVKIRRETNRNEIENREDSIADLVEKYSVMTKNEVAKFVDKVVIESITNVTEHGVASRDDGWWVLAQYHQTHKLISLCIADNGIGIKNSLITGPQRKQIKDRIKDTPQNDGDFLKLALNENISGAEDAVVNEKKTIFSKAKYKSGSRRGNGLKRIRDCCRDFNIRFSVLSHNGYAFMDGNGELENSDSKKSKVFAGTMLHYVIPAR